jgi:hypothetical protein
MESNPSRPGGPAKEERPMKLARAETTQPRLMVDYELLSSTTNLTLRGDTTYFVTGTVNVSGTVIIEGGTVVKYTTNDSDGPISATNFVCQTGPYRPGVFTTMNDNSVGSEISGSTGAPNISGPAMYLSFESLGTNSLLFRNLRVSYASDGIFGGIISPGTNSIEIWDCQFIDCYDAFWATVLANAPGFPINVYNTLLSRCANGFDGGGYLSYLSLSAINVTADQAGTFTGGGANVCYATNCVFTSVTNMSGISFSNCYTNASSNGVYQTVGAGSYYLADGSTNRGAGTTNIPPALLADLQTKTTYPPVVVPAGWFTNDYTFFPQAQRDNDGAPVDLGYHYDPIDYAVESMTVSNSTVAVLSGTVLATCGPEYGVYLLDGALLNCAGTATCPDYIVRYNTVQEQSNTNWEGTGGEACVKTDNIGSGTFYFTTWSALGGIEELYQSAGNFAPLSFQDCQFYNGIVNSSYQALSSANCLYQRVNTTLDDYGPGGVSKTFCNNLFWEGELTYGHIPGYHDSGTWTFRDNLFDQTVVSNMFSSNNIDCCLSNAYVTTNNGVLLPTNGMVILASSPAYEIGDLGEYYYPTNLPLIHAGSRSAPAAGLYHYTVTTNNVIEGTNIVSIGFHYVACTNGLPIDTNGDGIPDYLEDANGNGLVDSGEIAWNVAGDLGMTVVITQPSNNSKIP